MTPEQHAAYQDVETDLVKLWDVIVASQLSAEAVARLVAPYGLCPTPGGVSGYSELHDALDIDRAVEAHGGVASVQQSGQS